MTRWWLIGAAAFLAVLLIASIVLALTSRETEFAPGTPERAVQNLLRAAENDDVESSYALLSSELQGKCELKNFADSGGYRYRDDRDIRVALRDAKVIDDITFVTVQVTQFYGSGPFDNSMSSYDQRYALQQEGGEWKFTEYPWPYDYCDESDE